ncbi:MAG: hypothetical protein F4164_02905 [Gemmatimonadales bacterium]|nr:hypothetical protein [Gemmatimonadales bacterium]MYG48326.1 hypothetical protein [Gemmatimonadales bacterium]MYK01576.1 hypothetical protein [Candidatus Palauibacter ramosifaciens]
MLLALAAPAAALAQEREVPPPMTERAAAAALADGRLTPERDRALALALELGPRAGPELRAAVIGAVAAELRGETNRPKESEAIFTYLEAVAQLRDPQAVPVLVEALPFGAGAANALADLSPGSLPAVLEAVANPGERPHRVGNGLTALRFMLEDGSLSQRQIAPVREVVRDRLTGMQHHSVVSGAIRLALALGDPELRQTVERLAADRTAVEALVSPYLSDGVTRSRSHRQRIDGVQERARALLSGVSFPPHRRPFPHP